MRLLAIALVTALPACAVGQTPRLDAYGDALPEGAVCRIGTTRLRPGANVGAMVFTPDGKKLVTAAREVGVHVWDVATGKELHHLPQPSGNVLATVLSPDGVYVATLESGGVHVREVATGQTLFQAVQP